MQNWFHRFIREARDWLEDLRSDLPLEEIRFKILRKIDAFYFDALAKTSLIHDLDLMIVRDCARAWRSILHPRSERITGRSVLKIMVDAVRGVAHPEVRSGFWAEVYHLVRGVQGRVRLHEKDSLVLPENLSGREAALWRSRSLDRLAHKVEKHIARYEHGLSPKAIKRRKLRRQKILHILGGTEQDWYNWHWQLKHVARTANELSKIAVLTEDEIANIERAVAGNLPFGVTPYYASLFDDEPGGDRDRALRAQVIPPEDYIDVMLSSEARAEHDYMREHDTTVTDLVVRRYPGIVILKPYNSCPQICVYCQRNWEIEKPLAPGAGASEDRLAKAIGWIERHKGIHEVLITGGDPLVLSDSRLKAILDALASINHVERIRIGTRMLVTMPMRITHALCAMLGSYRKPGRREVCVITHIEHPYEVTPELVRAVQLLLREGIRVYNQLVYTFYVSRRFEACALRRLLSRCGVEPYYTFYPKGKEENASYRVPVARLVQEFKEEARLLPGLARTDEPVFNVPGIGKNHLNAWQHRDIISIDNDGARIYEFHPWEKKIAAQKTFIARDVPILDYLHRLEAIGEDINEYESIWYYF